RHRFTVVFQVKAHRIGYGCRRCVLVGDLFDLHFLRTARWRFAIVIIVGRPEAHGIFTFFFIRMYRFLFCAVFTVAKLPMIFIKSFWSAWYLLKRSEERRVGKECWYRCKSKY